MLKQESINLKEKYSYIGMDCKVNYPYSIKFSFNKKTYTHKFNESIYPELEAQRLNFATKNYYGIAVLGIKDAFDALGLTLEERTGVLRDKYVHSVILYDGISGEKVGAYPTINLKDDMEILNEFYNRGKTTNFNN